MQITVCKMGPNRIVNSYEFDFRRDPLAYRDTALLVNIQRSNQCQSRVKSSLPCQNSLGPEIILISYRFETKPHIWVQGASASKCECEIMQMG